MGKSSPSQSETLIGIASDWDLFHSPAGEVFAWLPVHEHTEVWKIPSREVRTFLSRCFYQEHGKAPSSQAMQDALGVLEARARFDGAEYNVELRVAQMAGDIYLDLGDHDWNSVHITRDGWSVAKDIPVRFRRSRGMLPLPFPERGGSIKTLGQFLNFNSDDDFKLLVSFIVAALRGVGPYPILVLNGEQGSAKSTAARVIRSLVDPNTAPLRRPPRDERDLMIAARNGHIVALDNLSYLRSWHSDALCVLSTGGGLSTRELYSDDEEILFDAVRPVVVNGIEEIAVRGDFLDRSIVLMLPQIDEKTRKEEKIFWKEFEANRPALVGALLDAVSTALRNEDAIHLERKPRMADFAKWSCAAASALGWSGETFLHVYNGNRKAANEVALESSIFGCALLDFMDGVEDWVGSASELLAGVEGIVDEKKRKGKEWPGTPIRASNALRRLVPSLRRVGIDVEFVRSPGRGRKRLIQINAERVGKRASESSETLDCSDPVRTTADDLRTTADDRYSRASACKVLKTKVADDVDDLDDGIPF